MVKERWLTRIVEVEWLDACTTSRWRSRKEYLDLAYPAKCRTAGYLLKKTKTSITIANSQGDNEDINGSMTIPRAWVQKMRRLS